jgi:methyl-accepting chemotaxis protein
MLARAVRQVVESADNVAAASTQLVQTSGQAGQATAQIASTIQQVAKGTAQQSEAVNKMADLMEDMAHVIDGVERGIQAQSQAIDQASQVSVKISARDGITDRVNHSAQKVQEMGGRSEQIGAIIETIEDIASQTNLLALNAAIEAARAGEHGKGFAVVADEVRKLAEKSSVATKEIANLIRGIQHTVSEAVDISAATAQDIGNVSTDLETAIHAVSDVVTENTSAAEKLAHSSSDTMESIESIAAVSEENSAAVEEVSAGAEEMSAQVEEVNASAQSLAEMAQILKQAVGHFAISLDTSGPNPSFRDTQPTSCVRSLPVPAGASGNGRRNLLP